MGLTPNPYEKLHRRCLVIKETGDATLIKLANGKTGWVPKSVSKLYDYLGSWREGSIYRRKIIQALRKYLP